MICLDTNIVYNFLFETELTELAENVIRESIIEGVTIPMIVYNELLYTVGSKVAKMKYSVKGKYSFKRYIAKHGFPEEAINMVNNFIKDFKATIIVDYQNLAELVETIKHYKLAPNDAQITITCKHNNVKTLASFDEDFKRVPWLKVIP
ncbi:MAG: PIN domain-containing protein [Desulfurococcales archaeon]|nr:PIN domain-containing protein [Desulfurococcales archaeon]